MNNIQTKKYEIEQIIDLVCDVFSQRNQIITKQHPERIEKFKRELGGIKPEDISWEFICKSISSETNRLYLILITILLEKNIYQLDNSNSLYQLLPYFNSLINKLFTEWNTLFCGDEIQNLIIILNHKNPHCRGPFVRHARVSPVVQP